MSRMDMPRAAAFSIPEGDEKPHFYPQGKYLTFLLFSIPVSLELFAW
jgi:hypothetical protein